jgi:hypothetical protein
MYLIRGKIVYIEPPNILAKKGNCSKRVNVIFIPKGGQIFFPKVVEIIRVIIIKS